MPTIAFQTSKGVIPVTGRTEAFDATLPAVIAITGAFAKADYMSRLPELMEPRYSGFVCHLPGNHSPPLTELSVDAFAQAFDEVVAQLARPVVVLGISIGALVALAMKKPAGIVAVEPSLSTGELWPMVAGLKPLLEQHPDFFWEIFGYGLQGGQPKNYRYLIDELSIPTTVVVGDEPLWPRRPISRYPSFVSASDRDYMAAHRLITLNVAPGSGHDVPMQAAGHLYRHLLDRCAAAF